MRLFDKLFRYEAIDRIFSDVAYIQSLLEFEAALAAGHPGHERGRV